MRTPIVVNRRLAIPLHRQIYDAWRTGILDGRFARGDRMPSSRELAAALRVSRATVAAAYDQLIAEGYLDLNYQALRNATGAIDGVLSFSYDVTPAVLARKKAEENEERLRFMADAMPVQVWTATADGKLDYVNRQTELYFGRTADEIIGDGWQAVVHPDDLPRVVETWVNCLQTREAYEVEFRLKNKTGAYRWHLGRANAFTGADSQVCWYGTNTDIHDMKLMQDQVRQSYEDLEVKVKFRNIELERSNRELQKKIEALQSSAS